MEREHPPEPATVRVEHDDQDRGATPGDDWRDFEARYPIGTLTGSDGRFIAIFGKSGETRIPVDIDGVRLWLVTPAGKEPGSEIAEAIRRVRLARGASWKGLDRARALGIGPELVDALRRGIRDELAGLVGERAPLSPSKKYMKVAEYAKYRGLCKRTIETRILEGMPLDGRGKYRRVDVERADEWFRNRGTAGLDDEAKLNAGRLARAQVRPQGVKP